MLARLIWGPILFFSFSICVSVSRSLLLHPTNPILPAAASQDCPFFPFSLQPSVCIANPRDCLHWPPYWAHPINCLSDSFEFTMYYIKPKLLLVPSLIIREQSHHWVPFWEGFKKPVTETWFYNILIFIVIVIIIFIIFILNLSTTSSISIVMNLVAKSDRSNGVMPTGCFQASKSNPKWRDED